MTELIVLVICAFVIVMAIMIWDDSDDDDWTKR